MFKNLRHQHRKGHRARNTKHRNRRGRRRTSDERSLVDGAWIPNEVAAIDAGRHASGAVGGDDLLVGGEVSVGRGVDDAVHSAGAVLAGGAVEYEGIGGLDLDLEDEFLFPGGMISFSFLGASQSMLQCFHFLSSCQIYRSGDTYSFAEGSIRRRSHIPRVEPIGHRLAGLLESPLSDGVVRRQESRGREVELDDVADVGGHGVGLVDEGVGESQVLDGEDLDGPLGEGVAREGEGRREEGFEGHHCAVV